MTVKTLKHLQEQINMSLISHACSFKIWPSSCWMAKSQAKVLITTKTQEFDLCSGSNAVVRDENLINIIRQ